MKTSIKRELKSYILEMISEGRLTNENKEDWHFYAFNEDYYLIGYYECNEWLKRHEIDAFEAIRICTKYENDNFGESKLYENSEQTVNMLAYIYGENILYSEDFETVEDLKEFCTVEDLKGFCEM